MNKFVVGARVRHRDIPSFGVGIVTSLKNARGFIEIQFEYRKSPWTTDFYHADKYEFLLPELKVGDKVRIADEPVVAHYYCPSFNGKVGTVIGFSGGDPDVLVAGVRYSQYVPLTDLTLVNVDPVEAVKAATPKVKTITFKKGSQCDRLVKYMLSGNSVTPIKARSLFGAERLAARILEIKKAGHKVKTVIKTDLNGKVYAEYSLRNVGRVAA